MNQPTTARGQDLPRRRAPRKPIIPREFAPLINTFTGDSQARIELWCYALVLLMIDEEQVRMLGTHQAAGREWATLQIYGGEEFEVVRPNLTEEEEDRLLAGVREIVDDARTRNRKQE